MAADPKNKNIAVIREDFLLIYRLDGIERTADIPLGFTEVNVSLGLSKWHFFPSVTT